MFFSSVNCATVCSQQAKMQTSLSQGEKAAYSFQTPTHKTKTLKFNNWLASSTDVTGFIALLKRYIIT